MQPKLSLIAVMLLAACQNQSNQNAWEGNSPISMNPILHPENFAPPRPEKKAKTLTDPGGQQREDPYYWLNERENPAVKTYLEAENRYFDSVMAPVAGLQQKLFDEMVARIKQDDNSVPHFKNGFWYYERFEKGKEYAIQCRKKGSLDAPEEILLDENEVAKGHEYCLVAGSNVSPDNRYLFYVVDFTGRNLFKSAIKDLTTGKLLDDSFDSAFGASAWANDSKSIFYDTKDAVTLRTDKVWRHKIGTDSKQDLCVFTETDETAYCSLEKSKSGKYIFINHGYSENYETHFLDADKPDGKFQLIKPREKGFVYSVDHHADKFIIRTNQEAQNFRLMEAPVSDPSRKNWKDILTPKKEALLADFEVFKDHLVATYRQDGLMKVKVYKWENLPKGHEIEFGEPTYEVSLKDNKEFDSQTLRFAFSSLKTPPQVVDYDMESRQKTVKKQEEVLGGYDPKNFTTEFVWARARDGAMVPVSLVYKNGLKRTGSSPCYLIGYGSYGSSYDPGFWPPVISLLERGFVFGIAHIRGGMEMGYQWYEDGKMLKKMNTFNDFIDCSEMICKEKYTSPDRLFIGGRSAGGLLMGAVTNLRPDLFKGVISGVPFVDVLTTMGDASIPLTTGEYTEWGNPANKAEYDYMAAYSPYDNLKPGNYPNIMVTTSFGDSQVQYFEPAKYVAKLRDMKTDKNVLIFKTSMSGSHGGSSGRFESLRERAQEYAWMMGLLGMTDEKLKN